MEQARADGRRVQGDGIGGRRLVVVILAGLLVAAAGLYAATRPPDAVPVTRVCASSGEARPAPQGGLEPVTRPPLRRSISLGLEDVVGPETGWADVADRLDRAGVNTVHLAAGRVEFVAFDWEAYPQAVARPGEDHLATALRNVGRMPDGSCRQVSIMIDAYVPGWIAEDPSIAGRDARGRASVYFPSASALLEGPVGERYIELMVAVAERYQPDQVAFAELAFDDETFGEEDLGLYRSMTGASDWPRREDGTIAEEAPEIAHWRADVLTAFLARAGNALEEVEQRTGQEIQLVMDVHVNWDDAAAGLPQVGHDYAKLATVVDELVLWAYLGLEGREPEHLDRVTAALEEMPVDRDRLTVSVGLWDERGRGEGEGEGETAISPETLAASLAAARTHDVAAVNVTPYSLLSDAHLEVLHEAWVHGSVTTPSG